MLATAPNRLDSWITSFADAPVPVLRRTATRLASLAADEDRADARSIASAVLDDPLMTLKVLAYVAKHRPVRREGDAETVTAAVLMIGIGRFFENFALQPTIRDVLGHDTEALSGLVAVLKRSYRAARFALGIAVQRRDTDAEVIHQAALLHDFVEALLWCHAPELALEMRRRQKADPALRSADVQRELLGCELIDIQQSLMRRWRLPELLVRISDDRNDEHPRVRNVVLAVNLARHTQDGWHNPAVPDDLAAIGRLLNQSSESVRRRMREIDA
jgi:HD-like signal output (HDOD) protein